VLEKKRNGGGANHERNEVAETRVVGRVGEFGTALLRGAGEDRVDFLEYAVLDVFLENQHKGAEEDSVGRGFISCSCQRALVYRSKDEYKRISG
jgi:hypothetical protein